MFLGSMGVAVAPVVFLCWFCSWRLSPLSPSFDCPSFLSRCPVVALVMPKRRYATARNPFGDSRKISNVSKSATKAQTNLIICISPPSCNFAPDSSDLATHFLTRVRSVKFLSFHFVTPAQAKGSGPTQNTQQTMIRLKTMPPNFKLLGLTLAAGNSLLSCLASTSPHLAHNACPAASQGALTFASLACCELSVCPGYAPCNKFFSMISVSDPYYPCRHHSNLSQLFSKRKHHIAYKNNGIMFHGCKIQPRH